MATGQPNVSSPSAEIPCHFCETRDQKQAESTDFCVHCDSNMCEGCTEWHKKFPSMIQHSVVSIPRGTKVVARPCHICETQDQKQVESTDFCDECNSNMCEGCTKWHKKFPAMIHHGVAGIPRGTKRKSEGNVKALGKSARTKPAEWKPISLKLRGEYPAWVESDFRVWEKSDYECNIYGICMLGTSVIITDEDNINIKELDSSYKVVRSLDIGSMPRDVCYTNRNKEVALFRIDGTVQFGRVGARLKKTRSFPVGDMCHGIACSKGELFVCCGYETDQCKVRVFSLAGTPLRTILYDLHGQPLFSEVHTVTVSSCGNKLYLTDYGEDIITVDRQHQVVGDFQQHTRVSAHGICLLDNGDLLLTTSGNNCQHFVQVSKDGRKQAVVLEVDQSYRIQALAYDPINSRIIAATTEDNTISVYDVQ